MSNLYMQLGIYNTLKLYKWNVSLGEFKPYTVTNYTDYIAAELADTYTLSSGGVLNTVYNSKIDKYIMFWIGQGLYNFDNSEIGYGGINSNMVSENIWCNSIQPINNTEQYQKYLIGNNHPRTTNGTASQAMFLVEHNHTTDQISKLGTNQAVHTYFQYFHVPSDLTYPHKFVRIIDTLTISVNRLNDTNGADFTQENVITTANVKFLDLVTFDSGKIFLIYVETDNVLTNHVTITEYNTQTNNFDFKQNLSLTIPSELIQLVVTNLQTFVVDGVLYLSVMTDFKRIDIFKYSSGADSWLLFQSIYFKPNVELLNSETSFDIKHLPGEFTMLAVLYATEELQELNFYKWVVNVGFVYNSTFDNRNTHDVFITNSFATVSLGVN